MQLEVTDEDTATMAIIIIIIMQTQLKAVIFYSIQAKTITRNKKIVFNFNYSITLSLHFA
jgi:hypothetical protein